MQTAAVTCLKYFGTDSPRLNLAWLYVTSLETITVHVARRDDLLVVEVSIALISLNKLLTPELFNSEVIQINTVDMPILS